MMLNEKIFIEPKFNDQFSVWVEHIPFAFYLTSLLQPRVFVELGTHYGGSYFAFCQAIKSDSIPCKSYAVDHWKGDEQAGYYKKEVFNYVSEINRSHFQEFSTLLKMSFDEASKKIEDKSVDLLHIDGMHSYEAVKHDFQTWLPKMSNCGVVLFHDTQVKINNFGVWKLFSELREQYPSFEFLHGCGLGILCIGTDVNPKLLEFIEAAKEESFIPELFASTGKLHLLEYQNKNLVKIVDLEHHDFAQLFYKDTGQNFSEEKSISQTVDKSNMELIFKFDEPEFVDGIRFDPLNRPAAITVKSIELLVNNSPLSPSYSVISNAFRTKKNYYFFVTNDPQIQLNFKGKKRLKIDEVRIELDYLQKGNDIIHPLAKEARKYRFLKKLIEKVKARFLKDK